jgi:hypothetical protein
VTVISVLEAHRITGISRAALYRAARAGELPVAGWDPLRFGRDELLGWAAGLSRDRAGRPIKALSSEGMFTVRVLALARRLGLLAHWCRDSRRCEGQPGFPDLVIAGDRGVIFAELKMPGQDTTAEQDLWGWRLINAWQVYALAGCPPRPWRIWTPADLADGTIETVLGELR